jgi:iron complex transport system substrate-binding protein
VTVVDAGGRPVTITDVSRIVSIGGDITETLYALGAGERIVAVDSTSVYPGQALKEKRNVGYMRALSSEGVLATAATVILASERSGPPEVVKTLRSASVPYLEVPDDPSPEGVARKVQLIAQAVGAEAKARALLDKIDAEFAELAARRAAIKRPVRALFVLSVQNGRAVVGGRGTSADAMLRLAGAENAGGAVAGFRPVTDEALLEVAPEAIVAMRRSAGNETHDVEQIFAVKGVQASPAGVARRLIMMEGQYLLAFGPRAPEAALELLRALYPDLAAATPRAEK